MHIDYGFRKDFYMIPDLQDLRKEIDAIDNQMTSLFEKGWKLPNR